MKGKTGKMGRRRFLHLAGGTLAGAGMAGCLPHVEGEWGSCQDEEPQLEPPASSRVVEVHAAAAIYQSEGQSQVDATVVAAMWRAGLTALLDVADEAAAWPLLLPGYQPGQGVGLKVNALNSMVPTRPELVNAVAGSLTGPGGVAAGDVFVWDRTGRELERAGLGAAGLPVASLGTVRSSSDESGPGYRQQASCLSGRQIRLSSLLTDRCRHLLNLAVCKNHFAAGFTGCLKNHYGSFANPYDYHDGCEQHIARLNALPEIVSVSRLFVLDALRAVTQGDTDKPPDAEPCRLLLGLDPVAVDQRGLELRDEVRAAAGLEAGAPAGYLEVAEGLGLGSRTYRLVSVEL